MLSVCMIVKNETANLKLTLPQIIKLAGEVIVVDTGSTDDTIETAENLGAKVYNFEWINDFAAARNFSLSLAKGPWIIWLDADEFIKSADFQALIDAAVNAPAGVSAFQLIMTESPYGKTERGNSYQRVKAFRNGRGIHFERTINEQVVDARGKIVSGEPLPIVVYHWGLYLNEQKMAEKKARYYQMYSNYLRDHADDPYVNYLLGNLLRGDGRNEEAYQAYLKAAETVGPDIELKKNIIGKIAEVDLKAGRFKEAYNWARELLAIDQRSVAAKNIMATLLIGVKQIEPAIALLEEVISEIKDSIDPIRELVIPRIIIADAYSRKGDQEKAEHYRAEAKELEKKYYANSAE
ncbi:MAG: glycosyltransferase [Candidatus Margulisbacteria bacterium]|nr:glycosyltransferase [Candidatus Margulisiibacteriota bacterium]MBU1616968.1 glycosyltransferase [Candidatus Margulisiibacteriota bacterium]MBU1867812.1 glycosyltransferase [Candidatus Margulisiibacteriota bacterium]